MASRTPAADPIHVPASVAATARLWDEQHLGLQAARRGIADAPRAGFTGRVAGPAADFADRWAHVARTLAGGAERRAAGLRDTAERFHRTDTRVGEDHRRLQAAVAPLR